MNSNRKNLLTALLIVLGILVVMEVWINDPTLENTDNSADNKVALTHSWSLLFSMAQFMMNLPTVSLNFAGRPNVPEYPSFKFMAEERIPDFEMKDEKAAEFPDMSTESASEAVESEHLIPGFTIHDRMVLSLDGIEAKDCTAKPGGMSIGKICAVSGKTYFLKLFYDSVRSEYETSATPNKPGILCYEEFNRQLAEDLIGIKIPASRFFIESRSWGGDDDFYFYLYSGTEKIRNLHLAAPDEIISDAQLGPRGLAKLAVAGSFIRDLHELNWGYDADGLVLVDVDATNRPPGNIEEYLETAQHHLLYLHNMAHLPMSLMDISNMIEIYEEMEDKTLPKFHDEFLLTDTLYGNLLEIYIKACRNAIKEVQNKHPELTLQDSTTEIREILANNIIRMKPEPGIEHARQAPGP